MDKGTVGKRTIGHRTWYSVETNTTLAVTIVEGVATVKNVPESELEPLQHAINVEALEQIFCPLPSGGFGSIGELTFIYEGCTIDIHSTGDIQIAQV